MSGDPSKAFYDLAASRFCQCVCAEPVLNKDKKMRAVAVDLDDPDAARNSSRWIVFLGACASCQLPLTYGANFGGYALKGLAGIKHAADMESDAHHVKIHWSSVLCHAADVKALPPL